MSLLSEAQFATLTRLCETFVPALDDPDSALYRTGASDVDLAQAVATGIERAASVTEQQALKAFLSALEVPLINQVAFGTNASFSGMTPAEREAVLVACANSRIPQARQIFQSLKRLSLFLFYSLLPDGRSNPAWASVNYGIPRFDAPAEAVPIPVLKVQPGQSALDCDILIIGSGAGGGVAAAVLSAAGYDVLVVEKGSYRRDHEFTGRELDATEHLFEKYGALATADGAVVVLAGSTLGGGTTINWAASLRTPTDVLDEWHGLGFTEATSSAYAASLDAVEARIGAQTLTPVSPQNQILERGCRALGYAVDAVPQNRIGCEDCGFCGFGCAFGSKQGTVKTFLRDASTHGARILVESRVDHITITQQRATGAQITVQQPDGHQQQVHVRAKAVVCAGGALHTPAILQRSGLGNANIGANLRLHPVTTVYGLFEDPVRGWEGAPLTRISRQFADLDGAGYGVRLECAPLHLGIAGLAIPWEGGRAHRDVMANVERLSNIIVLTRDRFGGTVTIDRHGEPVLRYRLHPHDAGHLRRGMVEALRVLNAAGASEISSPHNRRRVYRSQDARPFDAYLDETAAVPLVPNGFALFSAHQMASCRIGPTSATGALKPNGETYEVRGLYVTDASAMPTCTGVNPMVSILALSHYLSRGIAADMRPSD